jgi:5-methylcytosine-specific restriction endonuclease McrA
MSVRPRTGRERRRRQALISTHVARYGWTCPGYGCPAHPSRDLTADHVLPVAAGGSEEGAISVLCRSCNGRRGARGEAAQDAYDYRPRPRFSRQSLTNVERP